MFPIMLFIIPTMSVKPPNISSIPKGEVALACILQLAGLVPGRLPSIMLRKGLYPKLSDTFGSYADSKEVLRENGILRLYIPHEGEHPDFSSRELPMVQILVL